MEAGQYIRLSGGVQQRFCRSPEAGYLSSFTLMLPSLPHQLLILIAALAGGWVMLWNGGVAVQPDGTPGLSLLLSAHPLSAVGVFAGLGLLVLAIGLATGCFTHPLAGPFVLGAALVFPAVKGGTTDAWLRSIDSSSAYWLLVAESLIWMGVLAAFLWILKIADTKLRSRLPRAAAVRHQERDRLLADLVCRSDALGLMRRRAAKGGATVDGIGAGGDDRLKLIGGLAVAAGLGALLTEGLLRETGVQQAAWGIGVAFLISGMVAHQMFPTAGSLHLLLSPLVAAAGVYALAAVFGGGAAELLHSHYTERFFHGALAMPVFYASAGVAGAAMGFGWSEGLYRGGQAEEAEKAGENKPA